VAAEGLPEVHDQRLKYFLIAPSAVIVTGVTIYPLVSAFITSFRDWRLSRSPLPGPFVGLRHYARAFGDDPGFSNALWVTVRFVLIDVSATVISALLLALLLRRAGVLYSIARAVLILPFAVSPALVGISFRFMFNPETGVYARMATAILPASLDRVWLADPTFALLALALSDVWRWAPYMALVVLGGMAALSPEPEEAARIDGANEWQVLRDVTIPRLLPVLAVVAVLKSIFSLKVFDQVVTMTGGGPGQSTQTLAYLIYSNAFRWYDIGYASALAYILSIALVALAVVYMRLALKKARP
jgi:multiple sugar transport system permease protein